MITVPQTWAKFWKRKKEKKGAIKEDNNKEGDIDIFVNSLLIVVPRGAVNYEELRDKAMKIVEGHELKDDKNKKVK